MSGEQRKNLVVVRAGKNSLHPQWLEGAAERAWDLIVSAYDPAARFEHSPDVKVVLQPGGKWDGLHTLFAGSDLTSRYEYIWLPDDDIATTCADIDAIFAAMRSYNLEIAQPALTWESYFSHFAFMQCPGFALRYTNTVEIMVPCLKAGLLAQVVDDFHGSMSGFGMDSIWCRLSDDPRYKAAILDSVAVHHTRPVGKVLRGSMAGRGATPEEERRKLEARYNVRERIFPLIYAAVESDGRRREGCAGLGFAMAWRYLKDLGKFRDRVKAAEKIWQIVRRQSLKRPDLGPLKRVDSAGR
jgi:hypothetical protein